MINEKNYLKFLFTYKLTQDQFLFLHLCYKKEYNLIKEFKDTFNTPLITDNSLKDLIERGFIVKAGKGYNITNKFKEIYVDGDLATEEIYNLYPTYIMGSKGVKYPLIAMDRKVFKNIYLDKIHGDLAEHNKIIEDIKYGIDNNLIQCSLNKFLTSEMWKGFRKLRLSSNQSKTTKSVDNYKDF